jgi:LmbE family N-acetylglucosaminyl deacetylase
MRKLLLGLSLLIIRFSLSAQTPSNEIYLNLKKLNVLGSVLYIAAHPDDENNALLPYLAKEKMYRTAYLSLTRGDGGQNLIGPEQGIELGLIRTQELLAARKIDGSEQYFTRAYEFGYSKSSDEALRIWDHEKVLADAVWVIRQYQPDIIIARFPPDKRAGHGHHAASAIIAQEAYVAAADPTKFPEQLKFVKPWQAKRIFWNTFNFGNNNTTSDNQLKIDIGIYNSLLGKSYGEIGADARTMHKSQGEGRQRRKGSIMEYFTTTNGDTARQDLMENINIGWSRLPYKPYNFSIDSLVSILIKEFNFEHPDRSVTSLVRLYRVISELPDGVWKKKKLEEVQELLEQCTGLFVEATTTQESVVQGDTLRVTFLFNKRNPSAAVGLHTVQLENFDSTFSWTLSTNVNLSYNKNVLVPADKKISQPYWLEYPQTEGMFDVRDQTLIGRAETPPSIQASFTVNIEGVELTIKRPVQFKTIDPVRGEVYQPVAVLPAHEENFDKENYLVVDKNNAGDKIETQQKNGVNTHTIKYDHIPTLTYFKPAKANIVSLNLKIKGKRIGYIAGAGDKLPEALEAMGYDVKYLTEKDVTETNLKKFDAIITGIRAYNMYAWLSNKNDVLNNYVNNGGNLIVQYLKSNTVGLSKVKVGPYPFVVNAGSRVTEENAAVKFALPKHPVLNYPNKITNKDFEGWTQERSTYQAEQFDTTRFTTPLAMNDTDEKESNGSLAIAKYGKGNFAYVSLVLFRQLPAGVPGAYRLLANLIALPKNK